MRVLCIKLWNYLYRTDLVFFFYGTQEFHCSMTSIDVNFSAWYSRTVHLKWIWILHLSQYKLGGMNYFKRHFSLPRASVVVMRRQKSKLLCLASKMLPRLANVLSAVPTFNPPLHGPFPDATSTFGTLLYHSTGPISTFPNFWNSISLLPYCDNASTFLRVQIEC